MDPIIDIIWGDEDDDVVGTYGDPLLGSVCLTSCSTGSPQTCCPGMTTNCGGGPYTSGSQGQINCGC